MMDSKQQIFELLGDTLEVPESAYELASKRYQDLGSWLNDGQKAKCAGYSPHVSSQGSFRLGTVIKPIERGDYDLDLGCNLQTGITKVSHSQADLKELLRHDLENYRHERGIKDQLESKHRCWRLKYQDQLSFHMDAVPCIPEESSIVRGIENRMLLEGIDAISSGEIARLSVAITDDRLPNFKLRSQDWLVSNPEGYAKWFELRMRLAKQLLEQRATRRYAASIAELPTFRWHSPLQRCIKALKRHRDIMFQRNPDGKPISIILTTLAAKAYSGEADELQALENILEGMHLHVRDNYPRIANPVNSVEDFADRWSTPAGRKYRLEENFWAWLEQAKADFHNITRATQRVKVASLASEKLGLLLENESLDRIQGLSSSIAVTGPTFSIPNSAPARPWRK